MLITSLEYKNAISEHPILLSFVIALMSIGVLLLFGQPILIAVTVGVTVITAIWWMFELVPIAIASLLPIILLPIFGVLDTKEAASTFGHPIIVLLIGAFMMARAIEKTGLDNRLAFTIIGFFGKATPKRILCGVMITSAFLSMWMSNVATVLMMMPIVLGITSRSNSKHVGKIMLLGLAYSANIGGIATPIGTPANVVFSSIYTSYFNTQFGFLDWMAIALPVVIIAIPAVAYWLSRELSDDTPIKISKVGKWDSAQRRVLSIFALVVLAWVFRSGPWGGWSSLFPTLQIDDGTVALIGVVLMFIVSTGSSGTVGAHNTVRTSDKLLDWSTASTISWSVIFLLAGGICLAKGFKTSGLSELLGVAFMNLSQMPTMLTIMTLCFLVSFLTEITSNTATTALLMPILASAAIALNIDAKLLMIPAAMSASCAFMLPAATAPNAVIYGANYFSINYMMRKGFVVNILLAIIISTVCILSMG
uniref:SLC13 family permease n=1 Tax=Shewanella gaetbuli TaxID=220752 RepID=UPI003B5C4F1F